MAWDVGELGSALLPTWNSHDADRVAALYASDYEGVDVGQAGPQQGQDGIRRALAGYLRAFPDLHFAEEGSVVQGERVALAWKARGTHLGPLMNIPATGRSIEVQGMTMLTVQNGKIVRGMSIWDMAGLLRAMGLLPEL
jgi:steroid delta-isomerase-like uncharacterized protein